MSSTLTWETPGRGHFYDAHRNLVAIVESFFPVKFEVL